MVKMVIAKSLHKDNNVTVMVDEAPNICILNPFLKIDKVLDDLM